LQLRRWSCTGVCFFLNNLLHRGARVKKRGAVPHDGALTTTTHNTTVNYCCSKKRRNTDGEANKKTERPIGPGARAALLAGTYPLACGPPSHLYVPHPLFFTLSLYTLGKARSTRAKREVEKWRSGRPCCPRPGARGARPPPRAKCAQERLSSRFWQARGALVRKALEGPSGPARVRHCLRGHIRRPPYSLPLCTG
jgi:hypothetical protein